MHKIKISSLLLSCVLALASTASFADVTYAPSTAPVAKDGDYIQGSAPFVIFNLGYGGLNIPDASPSIWGINLDNSIQQSGWGATYSFGGGYLWYKNSFAYGVEADYNLYPANNITDNGGPNGSTTTLNYRATSISLMAVGEYFLTSWANLQLKVGPAYVMQNTSYNVENGSNGSTSQSANLNRIAPALGIGVGFYPDPHVGILLGFRYVTGTQPAQYQSPYGNASTPSFDDYNKGAPLMDFDLGVTVNI